MGAPAGVWSLPALPVGLPVSLRVLPAALATRKGRFSGLLAGSVLLPTPSPERLTASGRDDPSS